MQRRKVAILTKDPLLRRYLEQQLGADPAIELVEGLNNEPDAVVMDDRLLTATERQVLQMVADCGSIKAAATRLCRSERTIKQELAAIREKLGFRTTLQVIVWALQNGIVSTNKKDR